MKTKKLITYILLTLLFLPLSPVLSQDENEDVIRDTISLKLYERENIDTNICNIFPAKLSKKSIALVLSGGGSRGLSQLGVIKEFERAGIIPDLIVGTSIGSVIGGLYSGGYTTDELFEIFRTFDWDRALSLSNKYRRTALFPEQKKIQDKSLLTIPLDGITPVILPAAFSNGLFLSERINSFVLNARYHSNSDFDKLKIPFAAVATDIDKGERVVLTRGNLSESIKASLTFPLLYSPIEINGRNLVDGGLTANIPAEVARELGADLIIAVNSTSPLKEGEELENPISTADQILSITMAQLNELQLKEADAVITPPLGKRAITDFNNIDFLIRQGELSAAKEIQKIKTAIDSLYIAESDYKNNFIINSSLKLTFTGNLTDTLFRISDLMPKEFEKYTDVESKLRSLYMTGYFRSVKAVAERQGLIAHVNYILEPNPVFNAFVVPANTPDELRSRIAAYENMNAGQTANLNSLSELHDALLGDLRALGLSLIDFSEFRMDPETGIVQIGFTDGISDSLRIVGNRRTNENVITREITVPNNAPVVRSQIDKTLQNIMSTNLFEQVSMDFLPNGSDGRRLMKINVSEKNTKAIRLTAKIDNERNFQAFADIRDENLFGSGIEGGLLLGGGLRNQIYRAEIRSNQIFTLPLTFNINGYYKFRDINTYAQINDEETNEFEVVKTGEYSNIAGGFSLLAGSQLERLGTVYGQFFLQNQSIKIISGDPFISEDNDIAKLRFGGFFDTQDRWPFPTDGFLFDFYYETAKNLNNSQLSYTKLFVNYEQYLPVAKSHNFKPRFFFGFGDKTTPISDQFSLGGQFSFFGMVEDEIRGRQILAASLEYRFSFPHRIFFDTYLGARYDLGNVWQISSDIRFKDLRQGVGAFIAFDTPIGESSFAVGRSFFTRSGLQQDSFYFGPYVFYFSIGYEF